MSECGINNSRWVPSKAWDRAMVIAAMVLLYSLPMMAISVRPIKIAGAIGAAGSVVILVAYLGRMCWLERGRRALRDRVAGKHAVWIGIGQDQPTWRKGKSMLTDAIAATDAQPGETVAIDREGRARICGRPLVLAVDNTPRDTREDGSGR